MNFDQYRVSYRGQTDQTAIESQFVDRTGQPLTAVFSGLLPDTTYVVCVVTIVGQGELAQQSDETCTDAPTSMYYK